MHLLQRLIDLDKLGGHSQKFFRIRLLNTFHNLGNHYDL